MKKKFNFPAQTKLYPLTLGQQMILYSEKYCYKKEFSNICASIHFDSKIEPALMMQALYLAFLRSDACRIRLHRDGKATKMYFSDESPSPVMVLDYSEKSDEALRSDMEKWASVPFPNGRCDVQLYYACLIKKSSGNYAIFFNIHHIIMDTYGLFYLTSDILSIYEALDKSQPLPPNKSSTKELYQQEMDALSDNSDRKERQRRYWREAAQVEPLFCSINGSKSQMKDIIPGKRYGRIRRISNIKSREFNGSIPKNLVDAVREYCEKNHVSEQTAYYLGVRSHLARENGFADDVLLYSTIAKRSTMLEKFSGLTRADAVPYRMDMPNSTTFEEACRILSARQLEYYRNSSISATIEFSRAVEEKYGCPSGYAYYPIIATFQPYGIEAPEDMHFHFEHHAPGVLMHQVSMLLIKTDESGSLLANYEYSVAMVKESSVSALHEHLLHFLKTATENPQMTLEELMKSEPLRLS